MKIENGMYIKAEIRAVRYREQINKKTGEIMHFVSVIVEESAERDKRELNLSRAAVAKRLDTDLNGLVGKTCLIPFYITFNNNYLNYHYSGSELPIVIPEKTTAPNAQGNAA